MPYGLLWSYYLCELGGNKNLNIEVRLFANLAELLPPGSKNKRAKIDVPEGTTIQDLLDKLKIPANVTNVIMVNGSHRSKDTKLNDGDVVSIIPPITGG